MMLHHRRAAVSLLLCAGGSAARSDSSTGVAFCRRRTVSSCCGNGISAARIGGFPLCTRRIVSGSNHLQQFGLGNVTTMAKVSGRSLLFPPSLPPSQQAVIATVGMAPCVRQFSLSRISKMPENVAEVSKEELLAKPELSSPTADSTDASSPVASSSSPSSCSPSSPSSQQTSEEIISSAQSQAAEPESIAGSLSESSSSPSLANPESPSSSSSFSAASPSIASSPSSPSPSPSSSSSPSPSPSPSPSSSPSSSSSSPSLASLSSHAESAPLSNMIDASAHAPSAVSSKAPSMAPSSSSTTRNQSAAVDWSQESINTCLSAIQNQKLTVVPEGNFVVTPSALLKLLQHMTGRQRSETRIYTADTIWQLFMVIVQYGEHKSMNRVDFDLLINSISISWTVNATKLRNMEFQGRLRHVLSLMQDIGKIPGPVVMRHAIRAAVKNENYKEAEMLVAQMRLWGMVPNKSICETMLYAYKITDDRESFERMRSYMKEVRLDQDSEALFLIDLSFSLKRKEADRVRSLLNSFMASKPVSKFRTLYEKVGSMLLTMNDYELAMEILGKISSDARLYSISVQVKLMMYYNRNGMYLRAVDQWNALISKSFAYEGSALLPHIVFAARELRDIETAKRALNSVALFEDDSSVTELLRLVLAMEPQLSARHAVRWLEAFLIRGMAISRSYGIRCTIDLCFHLHLYVAVVANFGFMLNSPRFKKNLCMKLVDQVLKSCMKLRRIDTAHSALNLLSELPAEETNVPCASIVWALAATGRPLEAYQIVERAIATRQQRDPLAMADRNASASAISNLFDADTMELTNAYMLGLVDAGQFKEFFAFHRHLLSTNIPLTDGTHAAIMEALSRTGRTAEAINYFWEIPSKGPVALSSLVRMLAQPPDTINKIRGLSQRIRDRSIVIAQSERLSHAADMDSSRHFLARIDSPTIPECSESMDHFILALIDNGFVDQAALEVLDSGLSGQMPPSPSVICMLVASIIDKGLYKISRLDFLVPFYHAFPDILRRAAAVHAAINEWIVERTKSGIIKSEVSGEFKREMHERFQRIHFSGDFDGTDDVGSTEGAALGVSESQSSADNQDDESGSSDWLFSNNEKE